MIVDYTTQGLMNELIDSNVNRCCNIIHYIFTHVYVAETTLKHESFFYF